MEVRPYLVLGASDQRFLLERIDAALAAWREDWLPKNTPEFRRELVSQPQAERWLAADAGERRRVVLGCPSGWIAEVGAILTAQTPNAAAATGVPELAAQVGEAVLKGLAVGIFRYCSGAAPAKPQWGDEAPPDKGYIVGHFVKFIDTLNSGGGGTSACIVTAFGNCVAVLTK